MATTTTAERNVDTKHVAGRREVHYQHVDEMVADAERLLAGGYTRLGNWNLGTMCTHLSKAFLMALDGPPFQANPVVRWIARRLYKDKALRKMKPGFKLPKRAAVALLPHVDEDRLGVEELRRDAARWKAEKQRHSHPFFGSLTDDEWNTLMLRHAEMHMSFLLPKG